MQRELEAYSELPLSAAPAATEVGGDRGGIGNEKETNGVETTGVALRPADVQTQVGVEERCTVISDTRILADRKDNTV